MSSLSKYFGDSANKNNKATAPVYTGAYERVSVASDDAYHLTVIMSKGKPVAVLYGERVLPFVTEQATPEKAKDMQDVYRKGKAGLIDKLILRVAKS